MLLKAIKSSLIYVMMGNCLKGKISFDKIINEGQFNSNDYAEKKAGDFLGMLFRKGDV